MLPAVAAIAAILILPAHASVIGTTPAAGDVLTEQPGTFSVTMNEQILSVEGADSANAIQVTDASGLYYGDGCFTVDGDTISLDAELGEAGDYALTFQVVSSDGHPVSDTIDFSFEPAEGEAGEPGAAEAPVCGQASDIEIQAREVLRMREWLEETLSKHSNHDVAKVSQDIERDTFLSAEEALQYGLIDQVLTSRKTAPGQLGA